MKRYLSLSFIILAIISIFYYIKKQNDWSEINTLIYKTCVKDGVEKKICEINLHKLSVSWDEIYFLGGGVQGYADKIIDEKNHIELSPYCEYIVLKKNNKFKKVYTQCFDSSYSNLNNIDNSVHLLVDITQCKSPLLNKHFGEKVLLREYKNYYKNNKPIVYELSCEI